MHFFWNKRKMPEAAQEHPPAVEPADQAGEAPLPPSFLDGEEEADGDQQTDDGAYRFEFVLADDALRLRILRCVQPSKSDFFSYQNLNLAYGVYERKRHVFLTLVHHMSQAIMRDGRNVDDERYIVVNRLGAYTVSYEDPLFSSAFGNLSVPLLSKRDFDMVKQAILSYEDREKRRAFEETLRQTDPACSLYDLKQAELNRWLARQ